MKNKGYRLRVTGYGLRVTGYGLWVMGLTDAVGGTDEGFVLEDATRSHECQYEADEREGSPNGDIPVGRERHLSQPHVDSQYTVVACRIRLR